MTARCEPPAELRDRDGWHWLELFGQTKPAPYLWQADGPGIWCGIEKYGCTAPWAFERGYRYLSPVATPAEVEALRAENARLREALRPFADAADDLDDKHMPTSPIWESPAAMSIDAKDLLAARAAVGENANG